jgi:hypothetical protein
LLPLAVINVVITAVCVAFGWAWYVNFALDAVVIIAVIVYERRAIVSVSMPMTIQEAGKSREMMLPASVRLAQFESVKTETKATSASQAPAQEAASLP